MALVRILAALSLAATVPGLAPAEALAQQAPAASASFDLVAEGAAPTIFVSAGDAPVVGIAARAFAGDVERVSGVKPQVSEAAPSGRLAILAGTIGGSPVIERLIADKRIAVDKVAGQSEAYTIALVDKPVPGVDRALVVIGADRRGTAYGIFRLSEQIGVSPWVWWANVTPARRSSVRLNAGTVVQGSPSVRYRGLFINDEDWSIRPWATRIDPTGDMGPTTYAHVFELLLRLRANFLWPAMHKVSSAFNQVAGNAEMADRYAIVMGASHAEPMLRDNVAEWNFEQRGEFNYAKNGRNILDYWRDRVKANHQYENVYTVGMRGIHDSPAEMNKGFDGVRLLEKVVSDQRGLLSEVGQDPTKVPQIFVPYKEVLDIYRKGMKVPDDVTLAWVDDNYGYIRQLSTRAEQQRPGGGGVYYHISYWGVPNDYLWLDTTPPALIGEEMGKAYATNSRRLWVLNVGDIKPGEKGLNYFLDLAYDYDGTAKLGQQGWLKRWATGNFGPEQADAIAALLGDFYRLNYDRKPEHMGWNDAETAPRPTEFSPVAYGDEAGRRTAEFRDLDKRAEAIAAKLPAEKRDGFYHLVLYPVRGSAMMNVKMLNADRSFLYAHQGRASANLHADAAVDAYKRIKQATEAYNAVGGGQWSHFMSDEPRMQAVFNMPPLGRVTPSATPGLGVAVEGSIDAWAEHPARAADAADASLRVQRWRTASAPADRLPVFERATDARHFIDAFNTGTGTLDVSATASAPWIRIEREDQPGGDQRLWVSIDWRKLKAGETASGSVTISAAGASRSIAVSARNVAAPRGMLVEDNGIIAFSARRYAKLQPVGGLGWQAVPGLGRSGQALQSSVALASAADPAGAPYAEYRFRVTHAGDAKLRATLMPSFALNAENKLRYAVSIDGGPIQLVDADAKRDWSDGVERNAITSVTSWPALGAGEHRLRIYALDPGVVLDSLILDLGGLATAYLAPPETIAK
ncbi:glycosyl hydrolase 115 family protein [Sphingomonas sp. NIBR02145]|uniref:glycosyl hydrolase 115 family protein n=1 Tax=Sphingomonas sp. NIBR02145 TaxID=3014784 RepID=UPI0022B41926|nr:glycosyl hydrolase 115 family protein [Sphingomonas sp. NIBR02145]WHU03185.1 glycosyl hydrolase 115 family protein [Sphingomonas sp. NIBR02145]